MGEERYLWEGCEGREGGILVGTQDVQSVPGIVTVHDEYHPREGRWQVRVRCCLGRSGGSHREDRG